MKLKQVAVINAGYPFRGKILERAGSSVVVVQMKDVSLTEGIRWSNCIETELTGKREPDYLVKGDILVAARGSHNYAIQLDQTMESSGKRAVAAPHFFLVRLKTSYSEPDVLPEFMAWLLNQVPAQRYFDQNAEGTQTKSIRRGVLEDTPVVIPPLAKQQAIIAMANALSEEQKLIKKLVDNGGRMMSAIANDLYHANGL